jgi:GNAT superfamily N-acetyltransferase
MSISFGIASADDFGAMIKRDRRDNDGVFDPKFMKDQKHKEKMKYCSGENIFPWRSDYSNFIYAYVGDQIVGILKFKIGGPDSCMNSGYCNWIDFVSVDEDFKRQGIAKTMFTMLFKHLNDIGETHMLASGYSTQGFNMRYMLREMAAFAEIDFKDEDFIGFPEYPKKKRSES